MAILAVMICVTGAASGAFSAWWWLAAARVPIYYQAAMFSRDNANTVRAEKVAALNARAATAAAIAVGAQTVLLVISTIEIVK